MMHKTKFFPALFLTTTLAACVPTPQVPDSPAPSASASVGDGSPGQETPTVARIDVQVVLVDQQDRPVTDAEVKLISVSQSEQVARTNAEGVVNFSQIPQDVEYNIEVAKTGFISTSRKAEPGKLATQNQRALNLKIVVEKITTAVSGRVVDAQGNPLPGVSVFDTRQTTDTDREGRFVLNYDATANVNVNLNKTGFQPTSRTLQVQSGQVLELGDVTLQPSQDQRVIGIDLTHGSFGLSGTNALQNYQNVQSTLEAEGYRVQLIQNDFLGALPALDGLLVLSPNNAFSVEEKAAVQAFVLNGNKLVLTGEWAGFGGFSHANANQMLTPFNLILGTDTLRSTQTAGFLTTSNISDHPMVSGIQQLRFFQSASVRLDRLEASGELPVRTQDQTFRISNNVGAFGLIGVTPFGQGNVIVVGDSSLWSDEDSDGNQITNINEADNRKLLSQIFSW